MTGDTSRLGIAEKRPLFWLYASHLWGLWGIALSNGLLVLALAATAWRAKSLEWRRLRPIALPVSAYLMLLGASIALSYEPVVSLVEGKEVLSLLPLLLAPLLVRGREQVRRVLNGFNLMAALAAVYGLSQFFNGFGVEHRIRGPFSHYMTFAGVLMIADVLLIAQLVHPRGRKVWWRVLILVPINLALMGSLTRSAWVALFLTLTGLLIVRAPRWLLAYLPAGVLFFVLAPAPVVARVVSIFDLRDVSNYDRVCMVDAGLKMIAERPLFGIGPGMVSVRYPLYRHPSAPRETVPHLHNSLLQLTAERGLLSLVALIWIMGASFLTAWRGYRREVAEGGGCKDLYLGVILALLAFHLAGLFEDNWSDTEVQRIVLFAAAIPYCLRGPVP